MENKEIIIRGIFWLGIVMPSVVSFIGLIGFWGLYLTLTTDNAIIQTALQEDLGFRIGLISASVGMTITQLFVIFKCLDKVSSSKSDKILPNQRRRIKKDDD
jgi:hypothetical protein